MNEILAIVNPRKRRKHHYRRNPSSRRSSGGRAISYGHTMNLLKPAFIGAGGALANNAVFNYLGASILPASLTTGPVAYATKFASAIGLGMLLGKVVSHQTALKMTEGALIVTATQALQYAALTYAGVNLSGAGYLSPARVVNAPGMVTGVSGTGKFLTGTGKFLSGGSGVGNSRDYMQAGSRIIPIR